jgi:hypothetical protein
MRNRALILVDGTYKWVDAKFIYTIGGASVDVLYVAAAKRGDEGYIEAFVGKGTVAFTGYDLGSPWDVVHSNEDQGLGCYRKHLTLDEIAMLQNSVAADAREVEELRRLLAVGN